MVQEVSMESIIFGFFLLLSIAISASIHRRKCPLCKGEMSEAEEDFLGNCEECELKESV